MKKSPITIAFFEILPDEKKFIKRLFPKEYRLFFFKDALKDENADLIQDADIISVFIYSAVTEKVIASAKKLKLISTRSTGFNHINLNAAEKRNISVCNVPYYGENTVAEHTFALILALSRNVHKAYARTMRGDFSLQDLRGFDLKNKTLGVIGAGSIGAHVMKIAKGFGMNVIAFDVRQNHIIEEVLGFRYVSLEFLLGNSDVISLHCPFNSATRYLINMQNINLVKKGALFINTARSGIIEPSALYHAIDSGLFAGAGLDVFDGEELIHDENQMLTKNVSPENMEALMKRNILLRRDNVILTPHMAFDSHEAVERILQTTAENINAYLTSNDYYKVL